MTDLLNQAYMRTLFQNTTVVSGVQFFPFSPDISGQLSKGVSLICILVLPVALSMSFPVFLYQIVLEKETRLIEIMKINGLRMSNYWLVNFIFNLGFFSITMFVFLLAGSKVFRLEIFTETNLAIFVFAFLGWGYAQISIAFLLSVFVNKSQTATIVGYSFAVWFSIVSSIFNITIYSKPNVLDWFLYPIPSFTFSRIMYHIARSCGYERCLS